MDTKNNEECLNYLEQALEKDSNNNSIKEIIYMIFINLYWKKIEDKNLSETQNLVEKAIEKKILSKININISNFFESLYEKTDDIIKKYKNCIKYFLRYIRQSKYDKDFDDKYKSLLKILSFKIENDSCFFIKKDITFNNIKVLINEIDDDNLKYINNKLYKDLKSEILFKLSEIYLEKEINLKFGEKLIDEFFITQKGEKIDSRQTKSYFNLSSIRYEEQKYLEAFKIIDNFDKMIKKKITNGENIDFGGGEETIKLSCNKLKIKYLIKHLDENLEEEESNINKKYLNLLEELILKSQEQIENIEDINYKFNFFKVKNLIIYIEEQLEKSKYINLDKEFSLLSELIDKIKDRFPTIQKYIDKMNTFKIEYTKRMLINLMETKNYELCIKKCDEFINNYICEKFIIREIKTIKLKCLNALSDNLIVKNKKEEFMKMIEKISLLQQEINEELDINNTKHNLLSIMLNVINEKAEYFNRNNSYNVSENICELGLQLEPNNINLLTEKSINYMKKGYSNEAIENNGKILLIQSDNLSAILNNIYIISNLNLQNIKKEYIHFLIENINNTKLVDINSKIIVKRSIEVLTEIIKKYKNFRFFQNETFPKLKLLTFTYEVKELQYNSSELLKIYYSTFKKELITKEYNENYYYIYMFNFNINTWLESGIKELYEVDKYILKIIEKIIMNNNILLEVRINIVFLYSKIYPYLITKLKCYNIPLNFIEYLFRFREEFPDFINICLEVLLCFSRLKDIKFSRNLKKYLLDYIEKNIKNSNLMIDKCDIDEYLRENKYDQSKLEFTFESLKENFKKKYYEELVNKIYSENEINTKLLIYLKENYNIDLEEIINKNKKKIKINIEMIFNILYEYINNNFNEIKTEDLNHINNFLENECDLFIKDNIINLLYILSTKTDYYNKLSMKLLINLSKEILRNTNNSSDNSFNNEKYTVFLDKESIIMTNEKRITVLIGILYNFIIKKKFYEEKVDNSIFDNLGLYIKEQKVTKKNLNKIYEILNKNKDRLKGNINDIFEMEEKRKILEESKSDNEKIDAMSDIEKKINKGYDINIYTSNILDEIITDYINNDEIMNHAISLINTNVINNKKIEFKLSEKLMSMLLDENIVLNKSVFNNLVICLMNIVKNCRLDEGLKDSLFNNLNKFKEKQILNKIELIVISLKILTQKHYFFNKKAILDCIYLLANEKMEKTNPLFKTLEEILINSFNNQNLEKDVFNALFKLLYKNIDLIECISLCLLNSLKNKKKEEINILINFNLKKFEYLLLNNHINSNMILILCEASFDIYTNSELLKNFVFFTLKINDIRKKEHIQNLLILFSNIKIKICEYHIKIILDNLDIIGCFCLLQKIIETDEINFLKQIDINKIITKLYYDFENAINLVRKMIQYNFNFNDEDIITLSNYLYNNYKEDEHKNLHFQIKDILNQISKKQKLPNKVKNILILEDFSFKGKDFENKIDLFIDILSKNKIPKRYYVKIENIIENKYIDFNMKIKYISNIYLNALKRGEKFHDKLWEKFFSIITSFDALIELKYILINKNSNIYIKELFYKKFQEFLYFSKCNLENKINNILKISLIIEFKDIEYPDLQNGLINIISNPKIEENNSIQIIFWMVKNVLNKKHKLLLNEILKQSKLMKYFNKLNVENNFETDIKKVLYNILLNNQIKLLSEKCKEDFNQIKSIIIQYSPIDIEEDSEGIITTYIQFLNNIIIDDNSIINKIYDCIEYFSVIESNDKSEIINDKKYLDYLKEKWILTIIKKYKSYSNNISVSLKQKLIKNNFENNIIKNFIKIIRINNEAELNNFFLFYEKNKINIDLLKNILFRDLNRNISITELKGEIISILIDNYKETDEISKKFAKIIYQTSRWELEEIYQFLNIGKNIFHKLSETYLYCIEEAFKETQFCFNKRNKQGESLFEIFKRYEEKYWEYKIKQLGLPLESEKERTLDEILSELLNKNSTINDDLLKTLDEIKIIYYEIEREFHKERINEKKPIEKWEKQDIIDWVNSEETQKNINEDEFIPELLAVISQANYLSDGHLPRKVQLISILLFLFTPRNQGLFTQIKTGEGKTTIVAMLASINALRGKYVDVLTSSEILAERDSKEKQKFYQMFNLRVTHARNENFHKYNIVYGDSLSFEGDILRTLFRKNPTESDSEFQRGNQVIIIDEVDNMCVDNLDSATQLVSQFGGYAVINGIYPLIYQNLNIIDKCILEGKYPEINEDNIQVKTIEKLIEITKNIIEEGIKKNVFVFPEHIEEFVQNQIKHWCESAYYAKNVYKPNIHYVISGKEGKRKICPVDYQNTGVIHLNMNWGNGLHQFLQLKHGVKIESESLNTTFLSHYIFIMKYIKPRENNVYGLTGTLGKQSIIKLYKKLFGVNIIIVPTFRKSNFINLCPKIETTEENWKKSIIDNILNKINKKRVILVICKTIEIVSILANELKAKNYPEALIEKYQRNDDTNFKLKENYSPGNIIFATNLAGRGTDIKLTDEYYFCY